MGSEEGKQMSVRSNASSGDIAESESTVGVRAQRKQRSSTSSQPGNRRRNGALAAA